MGRIGRTLAHSVDHGKLQFLQKLPKVGKFLAKNVKHEEGGGETGKLTKNTHKESASRVNDAFKTEVDKPLESRTVKQAENEQSPWKAYKKEEGSLRTGSVVMGAKDYKGIEISGEDVFFDTNDDFDEVTFGNKKLHVSDEEDDDLEFFDCTDDDNVLGDSDASEINQKDAENFEKVEDSKKSEKSLPKEDAHEVKKPEAQVADAKVEASSEVKPKEVLPDKLMKQTLGEHFKESGKDIEKRLNNLGPLKSYGKSAYEKMAGMTIKELEHQGEDIDKLITDILGKWTSKVALPTIHKFMPSYKADAFSLMANWYIASSSADHPHTKDLSNIVDKALSHCKDDEQKMELLKNLVTNIAQKAFDEHMETGMPPSAHYKDQLKLALSKLQDQCGDAGKALCTDLSMDDYVLIACGGRPISNSEL